MNHFRRNGVPYLVGMIHVSILCAPLAAQMTTAQKANDIISYGEVSTNILLDTIHTLTSDNKPCMAKQQAFAVGLSIGISEILKNTIKKQRPDGSDWKSFPSEHTAIAFASSGWSIGYGYSIGLGTAASRVYANKHDKTDVTGGALIGIGSEFLSKKIWKCAS